MCLNPPAGLQPKRIGTGSRKRSYATSYCDRSFPIIKKHITEQFITGVTVIILPISSQIVQLKTECEREATVVDMVKVTVRPN